MILLEINDLIFRELLKRGYTIQENSRIWDVADSKLWYLTKSQAQGFLNLEKTKKYRKAIIEKEVSLIKQNIKKIEEKMESKFYNIIDLRCGDGKKAALFIKEFNKIASIRYGPIDISSYMVEQAAKTIRSMKIGEVIEFKWNISDFENLSNITPLLREKDFKNQFMLLLGNTLGNFDRQEIIH